MWWIAKASTCIQGKNCWCHYFRLPFEFFLSNDQNVMNAEVMQNLSSARKFDDVRCYSFMICFISIQVNVMTSKMLQNGSIARNFDGITFNCLLNLSYRWTRTWWLAQWGKMCPVQEHLMMLTSTAWWIFPIDWRECGLLKWCLMCPG